MQNFHATAGCPWEKFRRRERSSLSRRAANGAHDPTTNSEIKRSQNEKLRNRSTEDLNVGRLDGVCLKNQNGCAEGRSQQRIFRLGHEEAVDPAEKHAEKKDRAKHQSRTKIDIAFSN